MTVLLLGYMTVQSSKCVCVYVCMHACACRCVCVCACANNYNWCKLLYGWCKFPQYYTQTTILHVMMYVFQANPTYKLQLHVCVLCKSHVQTIITCVCVLSKSDIQTKSRITCVPSRVGICLTPEIN